ncbi:MAG: hypothetical protein LBQ93_09550 [Treponema sp.]|jgi:hypothetical protein|nr:hypothetical protein [Treponema sp.]
MKKTFRIIFLFLIIFLLLGCSPRQQLFPKNHKLSSKQFKLKNKEEEILNFIIEQINNTASYFFYDDVNKALENRKGKGIPVPERITIINNIIAGDNEKGGVCIDYALHFIDNYTGPGEVYLFCIDEKGVANTEKRIKLFELSDIIIDLIPFDSFIEKAHKLILEKTDARFAANRWRNDLWGIDDDFVFFTKKINGIVYWAEKYEQFESDPLVLFRKEHIREAIVNYQLQDEYKENMAKLLFNYILEDYEKLLETKRIIYQPFVGETYWFLNNNPIYLYIAENIYLYEYKSVSTPKFHAGEITVFDHAWVRIIWNEMVIDIDPTWYDIGIPLERVIEVIE